MKLSHTLCVISALSLVASHSADAAALAITDEYIIAGDGTVIPVGGDAATAFNSGNPSNAAAWDYAARERGNAGQLNRRVASFLQFDTSSLSAADVNDPNFTATFTIDHVGHLNNINAGMDLGIGQVVSGAWDDDGGATPVFGWAAASTGQTTLLQNVQNSPNAVTGLTFDATAVIQDWVLNGTNQGFALFGYLDDGTGNPTNASYLNNAALEWEIIPEPSTGILGLFGASALLFRRRRS